MGCHFLLQGIFPNRPRASNYNLHILTSCVLGPSRSMQACLDSLSLSWPASSPPQASPRPPRCHDPVPLHMLHTLPGSCLPLPGKSYFFKTLKKKVSASILTTAVFTIAKAWPQPKCPSKDKWINNIWYIHTVEYYSTLKRKEILMHIMTRMNLEDIMQSEITQTQKDIWCIIPLI